MSSGRDIMAEMERKEKEKTGIPKLKIGYNRVFGYFIEVSNSFKNKVPADYIRKQTLSNCERYITMELKEIEGRVLGAKIELFSWSMNCFVKLEKSCRQFK